MTGRPLSSEPLRPLKFPQTGTQDKQDTCLLRGGGRKKEETKTKRSLSVVLSVVPLLRDVVDTLSLPSRPSIMTPFSHVKLFSVFQVSLPAYPPHHRRRHAFAAMKLASHGHKKKTRFFPSAPATFPFPFPPTPQLILHAQHLN